MSISGAKEQAAKLLADPDYRERYEEARSRFAAEGKRLKEAIRSSERLSGEDLVIRMNAKPVLAEETP